jgi:hypothetical protein
LLFGVLLIGVIVSTMRGGDATPVHTSNPYIDSRPVAAPSMDSLERARLEGELARVRDERDEAERKLRSCRFDLDDAESRLRSRD